MLYSCAYMATVGVRGLMYGRSVKNVSTSQYCFAEQFSMESLPHRPCGLGPWFNGGRILTRRRLVVLRWRGREGKYWRCLRAISCEITSICWKVAKRKVKKTVQWWSGD